MPIETQGRNCLAPPPLGPPRAAPTAVPIAANYQLSGEQNVAPTLLFAQPLCATVSSSRPKTAAVTSTSFAALCAAHCVPLWYHHQGRLFLLHGCRTSCE
ncbi:putative outer membrane autotransporter, pertactin domain protein [Sesbania bispinosa]|nr:putative outer membrane autotransporter, pertactin domain protein [Sesbania bispinosa]